MRGVFLDLSKVFDTIDQCILLYKLKYGVREIVLDWFAYHLPDKKIVARFNGVSLNLQNTNCGLPQGSVLGELLF